MEKFGIAELLVNKDLLEKALRFKKLGAVVPMEEILQKISEEIERWPQNHFQWVGLKGIYHFCRSDYENALNCFLKKIHAFLKSKFLVSTKTSLLESLCEELKSYKGVVFSNRDEEENTLEKIRERVWDSFSYVEIFQTVFPSGIEAKTVLENLNWIVEIRKDLVFLATSYNRVLEKDNKKSEKYFLMSTLLIPTHTCLGFLKKEYGAESIDFASSIIPIVEYGNFLEDQKRNEEAKALFSYGKKILNAFDGEESSILYDFGAKVFFAHEDQFERSLKQIEYGLKRKKDCVFLLHKKALILNLLDQKINALTFLKQIQQTKEGEFYVDALYLLAGLKSHFYGSTDEEAQLACLRVLEINPQHKEAKELAIDHKWIVVIAEEKN